MRIGIVGAGKIGTALASVLVKKGFQVVAIAARRDESLAAARSFAGEHVFYTKDPIEVVTRSDVIGVTTQDREIGRVAADIASRVERLEGKIFFHTSGAHPASELGPLGEKGALLGSLHPLQTFPDIQSGIDALPRTYFFLEGDPRALERLEVLAGALGFRSVRIESEHKVLYHLSAVFVCNLLTALLYTSQGITERIGIDLTPFFPIIKTTVENIERKGPLLSLTGPVVRGDVATVRSHLEAMEGMAMQEDIYKALSRVALRMAEERGTLTADQAEALWRLLTGQP